VEEWRMVLRVREEEEGTDLGLLEGGCGLLVLKE
jgi:hypothetical protein